jgi:hypothetical protein
MPRWEPPTEQIIEPPKPKRWPFVVLLLAVLGVAAGGLWMIYRRQHTALRRESLPTAMNVRSELAAAQDSLQVIVSWDIDLRSAVVRRVDSVRVEVGLGDGRQSQTSVSSSEQRTDTLRLPAPAAGQTASGYSCVATLEAARLSRETCTPWQYVRPTAELQTAPPGPGPDTASASDTARRNRRQSARTVEATVAHIVIQPEGQQVDPDLGGKCSAWQRRHPELSVWVDVNREAVPDCTGPNGKPTVAKFCAFAVLTDGRRVKTATSSNDTYCERLFQLWVRERVA